MTDHWPQQGGVDKPAYIVPGFEIGFCYCKDGGVTEGYAVTIGTHESGKVPVKTSAGVGDAVGIALKTGSQYDYVPVVFYGVYKLDTSGAVTIGKFVIGASGGATVLQNSNSNTSATLVVFGGASYILGMALQTATSGDEILVLLGKCM